MDGAESPNLLETIEELKTIVQDQTRELVSQKQQIETLSARYDQKSQAYDQKAQAYDEKAKAYAEKVQEYLEIYEKYKILQSAFFGRSSEKWSVDDRYQASLFNEAEITVDEAGIEVTQDLDTTTYTVTRKRRGKRKPIPEGLPRETILVDISEEEKVCGCGQELVRIGAETSEKLDLIPAQIKVLRYVRPQYACPECEGSADEDRPAVRMAPPPTELLPKSLASAGLVSHIITAKYCDALPLYRQERIFRRMGVEIPRASMARWVITLSGRLSPLLDLIDAEIRSGPAVWMDESRLRVHKEPRRSDTTSSYMWVALGGSRQSRLVRYLYSPTRSSDVPSSYLKRYEGFLQTDAYKGYLAVVESEKIVHVLCLAHVRRKFDEATKVKGGSPAAREIMAIIQKIYQIEKDLRQRNLKDHIFLEERKKATKPIFEKLDHHLEKKVKQVAPSTALGCALSYAIKTLPKVKNYLELACLTPDNNAAERAIRPFVVGRKNWLHADTPRGAHASACFYSLIESAKLRGLEPYWYIRYVLKNLPTIESNGDWQSLLPYTVSQNDILASM